MPRAVGPLNVRAVGVRPPVVERITGRDVNVTAQHLAVLGPERFDVIIATNVFVSYDRLQQGLGMISVANMLRPGGVLLSNNALVEVPATGLKSIGYSKTLYSGREEDGDLIIWYQMVVPVVSFGWPMPAGKQFLIVEDDANSREGYRTVSLWCGLQCPHAAGRRARARFRPVGVARSRRAGSGSSGSRRVGSRRRLKSDEQTKSIPIIAFSGRSMQHEQASALRAGCDVL